jgi:PAS domain-containing protein
MDRLPALAVIFVAFMFPARRAFAAWEVSDTALVGVGALALVGFVLAAIFDAKLRRERRARARDVARLGEEQKKLTRALDDVPALVFHWPAHGITVGPSNCMLLGRRHGLFGSDDREIEDFDELARYLKPDDFARLNEAVSALRAEGTAFRLDFANLDDTKTFAAEGIGPSDEATEPGASGVSLWLRDSTTETQETRRMEAEAAELHARAMRLRTILDTVDLPVWQRNAAFDLVWCNQAYGDSVEASIETALKDGGIELASNISRAEARALSRNALASESQTTGRQHVVMNGERRLLEMVETPLADGRGTIGWARDITDFETAQADLLRHVDAHAEVLESLGTAISIYGPTQRLMFFNSEFVKLFQLDEAWLRSEPPLSEVLQAQRDLRRLPEQADWRAYRERMVALFTSVTEPIEELLHLPDSSTPRMSRTASHSSAPTARSWPFNAPRWTICTKPLPCSGPMVDSSYRIPATGRCGI